MIFNAFAVIEIAKIFAFYKSKRRPVLEKQQKQKPTKVKPCHERGKLFHLSAGIKLTMALFVRAGTGSGEPEKLTENQAPAQYFPGLNFGTSRSTSLIITFF